MLSARRVLREFPHKQHIYSNIYIYISVKNFIYPPNRQTGTDCLAAGPPLSPSPARGRGDAKNALCPWGTRDGERGRSQSIKIKVLDPHFRGDDTLKILGAQKEYPAPPPETSSGDA
jgi:hypothetical protein